ncbi:MAG: exo-alpha-sialidase [Verrucomicrobiales bacterium]|nr:exo-alpha-sialidase [Verrucomicrobiales bacterium]
METSRMPEFKKHRIPCLLLLILFTAGLATSGSASAEPKPVLMEARRIWDKGNYNAFTDLVRFRDRWFCCFREGLEHAGDDGKVRVLQSDDGLEWTSAALIEEAGVDLRDPKFSVKPDGQLMIVAGGTVWRDDSETPLQKSKHTRAIFSDDGLVWSAPQKIFEEDHWLWRIDWHEGKAYGIAYPYKRAAHPDPKIAEAAEADGPVPTGPYDWKPKLVTSTDGLHWEVVTHLDIPGRPNEATVRVRRDGEMIALVRRERGTYFGWIGVSQSPYKEWTWHETEHRLGGPNFIVLPDDSLIAAGRKYRDPFSTVVASMDREHYDVQLILPSGGSDTGYPGMVWHEGELWVSYYSSHEDKEGNPPPNRHTALPTAIYIARVKLE